MLSHGETQKHFSVVAAIQLCECQSPQIAKGNH